MSLAKPTGRTVYVPVRSNHTYTEVREILRDSVEGIKKVYFASNHLFVTFRNESLAEKAVNVLNAAGELTAQMSRTEFADEHGPGGEDRAERAGSGRTPNEPSPVLVVNAPRAFPKDEVSKMLKLYPGFEKLEGRRAHFRDAMAALSAYEDLTGTTNFNVHFGRWPDDERGQKADGRTANSVTPTGEEEIGEEKKTAGAASTGGSKVVQVTGLPGGPDYPIVRELLGLFSRYRGFVRLAMHAGGIAHVEFADVESAQRAITRIQGTTRFKAAPATTRRPDPGRFSLEKPVPSLFVRLEPYLREKGVQMLFESMDGFKDIRIPSATHAIITFDSTERAKKALERLRETTNLVVNFAKNVPERGTGGGRSNSNAGPERRGSRKEWPAVNLTNPPLGLNVKELFTREKGFLHLLFEEDGSHIALFATQEDAQHALTQVQRLVSSDPTLIRHELPQKRIFEDVDPSPVLFLAGHPCLTEGQLKRILQAYDGFVDFRSFLRGSEGHCLGLFASVPDAKRALEDLWTTTNLNANFSKKGESIFDENASHAAAPSKASGRGVGRRASRNTLRGSRRIDDDDESYNTPPSRAAGVTPRGGSVSQNPPANSPKRTIHLTSPPLNKALLKKFVVGSLGAERLVLKRTNGYPGGDYSFVLFPDVESATKAIPKIQERWPACHADYARNDYVPDPPIPVGNPCNILYIVTQYSVIHDELDAILREYEGYEGLQYEAYHSRIYFDSTEHASEALHNLNETTGFQVAYSDAGQHRSRKSEGRERRAEFGEKPKGGGRGRRGSANDDAGGSGGEEAGVTTESNGDVNVRRPRPRRSRRNLRDEGAKKGKGPANAANGTSSGDSGEGADAEKETGTESETKPSHRKSTGRRYARGKRGSGDAGANGEAASGDEKRVDTKVKIEEDTKIKIKAETSDSV
ncbi:hypothetical protein HK104_004884 [Borealophlyctis nickersoniae]|nr:hypothetical protein HK104_004884 [Borealophlyctis nickersoniae]